MKKNIQNTAVSIKYSDLPLSPNLCDCWTPAFLPHKTQSSIILLAATEGLFFLHESNKTHFLTPFLTTNTPGAKSIGADGAEKHEPAPCESVQVQKRANFYKAPGFTNLHCY